MHISSRPIATRHLLRNCDNLKEQAATCQGIYHKSKMGVALQKIHYIHLKNDSIDFFSNYKLECHRSESNDVKTLHIGQGMPKIGAATADSHISGQDAKT